MKTVSNKVNLTNDNEDSDMLHTPIINIHASE